MDEFYVYTLTDPRNDKIFYVGKGKKDRMTKHERSVLRGRNTHNNYLTNKIKKIHSEGLRVKHDKVLVSKDEDEVLEFETFVIDEIGLDNLCNNQGGGDGRTPDESTRKKISEKRKGIPVSKETRERISESRRGKKHTQEWKDNQSKLKKGKSQTQKQKDANESRSKSHKGRKFSDEHRKKLSEAKKKNPTKYWEGKIISKEMRDKISKTLKEKFDE